ncbi:hypothetical protein K445DRAFT_203020 [Daldinia sp. EC12]|nr:hypothetical protein K445DRAFT_203020 [Daldinia sp. EC12]
MIVILKEGLWRGFPYHYYISVIIHLSIYLSSLFSWYFSLSSSAKAEGTYESISY